MMGQGKEIRPFGIRDKIGYLFGDFGNDVMLVFVSQFLMVFYTQVWGMKPTVVGTMFLVARLIDAFTDVTMGRIIDITPQGKDGKFKKWIRIMAAPVAIASFLMYQSVLKDQPMTFKIIYMYITYLLYGSICFTGVNIPYGAMASAITDKPDERQSLITFRAMGAYIGEFIIGFFGPIIIYERVIKNGTTHVLIRNNGDIFPIAAGAISLVAILCYYICYQCTTERIKVPALSKEGLSFTKSVKMIFSNRAMIGILGGTVCLIFGNLLTGGVNAYLYAYYFKMPAALSTYNAIKLVIALGMATLVTLVVKKLGKRESISLAVGFAALVFATLSFLNIKNPWVYVSIASIGFSGVTFFGYVIWGAIIDVIDDSEIKTGRREDGTLYAIYSFSRKVGQALGSSLVGYSLAIIGFQAGTKEQTQEVLNGIYKLATVAPATLFTLVVIIFMLVYPLSKKKVDANAETLRLRREEKEIK